jgi:hypothetical protein
MSLQGSLNIERLCQMVPVSRRSFYRSLKEQQPVEEEMEVRSVIQQITLVKVQTELLRACLTYNLQHWARLNKLRAACRKLKKEKSAGRHRDFSKNLKNRATIFLESAFNRSNQ